MIKITTSAEKKGPGPLLAVLVISSFIHLGFYFMGATYAAGHHPEQRGPSRIEFTTPAPTPAPPKVPEKVSEPIEKPLDPEPEITPPPRTRAPRANTRKTAPQPEKSAPVFGATDASVVDGDSGVAIRVGNTLEKAMEKEAPPKRIQPLAPIEEPELPVQVEPPPPQPAPVPVYALSNTPTFKKQIEPVYPQPAREAEIEGVVQLDVLIGKDGRVKKIKVLSTPGHDLEKAAIIAVSKSTFTPGMVDGKPVPVRITIPFRFELH